MLNGTDWLNEQWYFDPRNENRSLRGMAIARRMRTARFDMAVLLTNSLRTAMVAWLGRATERIGYAHYGRGPLLTGRLYPRRVGRKPVAMPMVETYLEIARALGCGEGIAPAGISHHRGRRAARRMPCSSGSGCAATDASSR